MSEILEFVFNNEEKTVVKVPNTTKINMSVDGEFQLIEFIPEVEVYVPKLKIGEWVKSNHNGEICMLGKAGKLQDDYWTKATPEEIDGYLKQKNQMLDDNGNIVDWKPKKLEIYYVSNICENSLFGIYNYTNDKLDSMFLSRKIAFPTKEQAIEKTKELLNIK